MAYDQTSLGEIKSAISVALDGLSQSELIASINEIRAHIHELSPFKNEPVDFVRWVPSQNVTANDYNPNSVAPPEMELLRTSIMADGYTQPIVTNLEEEETIVVVDGFHRSRVGKECQDVASRVHGYLPVVQIRDEQSDRNTRIASTIRHNRARGKHKVEAMSDIVVELKRRNWSDNRIAKELGMDQDEILRLCQITGLSEVFADEDFSQSWEAKIFSEDQVELITESDVQGIGLDDDTRIFHEWSDWECFPAGFYNENPPKGMTVEECERAYADFLSDLPRFEASLQRVIIEWKYSCEHYLTNEKMNRIAWLGQAAMCLEASVPSRFCGGYNLLDDEQKQSADNLAFQYLNKWLSANDKGLLTWDEAQSKTAANLY